MKVRPLVAWFDAWVGAFWDSKRRFLYLLPVPFFGVVLEFGPRRRYDHGLVAFWRWSEVLHAGRAYLTRLHVAKVEVADRHGRRRGGAVMVHRIHGPDPWTDLHDHPVSFLSIVIRGGYVEETPTHWRRRVRWWNFKRAEDTHRIVEVRPGTTTLVFCGPKRREWGYHTGGGWVGWREYQAESEAVS